jgi:hypothetical protein
MSVMARSVSRAMHSILVFVSEEIHHIIDDYFKTEPHAPVELKGKVGRVTPHQTMPVEKPELFRAFNSKF